MIVVRYQMLQPAPLYTTIFCLSFMQTPVLYPDRLIGTRHKPNPGGSTAASLPLTVPISLSGHKTSVRHKYKKLLYYQWITLSLDKNCRVQRASTAKTPFYRGTSTSVIICRCVCRPATKPPYQPVTSFSPLPMSAKLRTVLTPASSRAANFSLAVPLPPEIIAPAWPIRLPGGAVTPAI